MASAARMAGSALLTGLKSCCFGQALIKRGVVGDYRPPDTLRFGFTPLYTRYVDVWDAVQRLKQIMDSHEWDTPDLWKRNMVT